MSIDVRARAAVVELRDTTRRDLPALTDVVLAHERRRRSRFAAVAVVSVGLLAAGLLLTTRAPGATPVPAGPPTPRFVEATGLACEMPGITCSGPRMRVGGALGLPVSFQPLAGMDLDTVTGGTCSLWLHRTVDGVESGVTVLEEPVALEGDHEHPVLSLDGAGAARTAQWLATRAFVRPTQVRQATVGGLPAYRVDVALREGAQLPTSYRNHPAARTFGINGEESDQASAAVSEHVRDATYLVLDVPGQGLVVLWVWAWEGTRADVESMLPLVDTLRFG